MRTHTRNFVIFVFVFPFRSHAPLHGLRFLPSARRLRVRHVGRHGLPARGVALRRIEGLTSPYNREHPFLAERRPRPDCPTNLLDPEQHRTFPNRRAQDQMSGVGGWEKQRIASLLRPDNARDRLNKEVHLPQRESGPKTIRISGLVCGLRT